MKYKERRKKIILPPADIILELLNDEPQNDIHLLEFYNGYIHAAATESLYTVDGLKAGYHINEDLVQEIRIEFLKSLSALRSTSIGIL
ncbi:MAG: helix-turn-helix domain-containing protein [Clostridiales bacterium]|nr:helix-turn-helix domain-containing protein [Clostridiales bacterium]